MKPERSTGLRRITVVGMLVFFCTLMLLAWFLLWSESTHKVDRLLHDSWVRAYQRSVPSDVVIASIDSTSLSELGRWPWPRTIQAQLFEQLQLSGVRAVVVDLLYVEHADKTDDARLAAAIGSLPISILPVLTERGRRNIEIESLPISVITHEVTDLGHIFLPIDDDGIVRRVFLKSGFNQSHWPALSLAALQALGEQSEPLPGQFRQGSRIEGLWVENHEVLIPFYGSNGAFQRVSAIDILSGNVPKAQLANKIVFVGMTTTGLGDVVPTPVSALDQPVPGVEIHATIFSALRDQSLVTVASSFSTLLVAGALLPLMLLIYSRASPQWAFVSAVVGAFAPVVISFLLYRYARLWYAPLSASLPILISYLLWSWHRLAYVNRFLEREQNKLEPHLPQRDSQSNALLADFFTTAMRHLPIQGWRFHAGVDVFTGGVGLPEGRTANSEGSWRIRQNIYTRTYPGKEPLHIELVIDDEEHGVPITQYVDTLARVRSRERASRMSGSIEKLQTNAWKLSEQMEWLRSVKHFSETILDGSPVGFGVWNAAGECVRANRLLYRMVPDLAERADFMDFLIGVGSQIDYKEAASRVQQLILDSKSWQVSCTLGSRELVVNFRAVGQVLAERLICASVLDVTDIRTSERARAEMVDYLSHDLRSPLISALYLLDQENDPRIEQNIQQSLSMMDDLLHVARADSLTEASFEPLLLNAVVDNALDQMLPQALSAKIRFDVDTVDDDLWVEGDAASLERAVTNIVGNAIKYSPEQSIVRIHLFEENEIAILTIDDEGVGVDPDMLGQMFARFKRDHSTASQFTGIGLGLALVSRVVSMHGGTVFASNRPVGTRITMLIPLEGGLQRDADQDSARDTARDTMVLVSQ